MRGGGACGRNGWAAMGMTAQGSGLHPGHEGRDLGGDGADALPDCDDERAWDAAHVAVSRDEGEQDLDDGRQIVSGDCGIHGRKTNTLDGVGASRVGGNGASA